MRRKRLWAGLGVVLALGGSVVRAAEWEACWPPPSRATRSAKPCKSECGQSLERKLLHPIGLNIKDVPLRQVVEELHQLTGISIVLDRAALEDAGIDFDYPLTLRVDNVSIQTALHLLVKQVRLAWVVKDEVVQITTAGEARGKRKTVSYPVADLILPIASGEDGDLLPVVCRDDAEAAKQHKPGQTCEDQLIKRITSTIEPATWSDMGGKGTIQYFPLDLSLVVNQTADIQEQVQDLLRALRCAQAQEYREMRLETAVVESGPDGKQTTRLPAITFFRGQRVHVMTGQTVPVPQATVSGTGGAVGCDHPGKPTATAGQVEWIDVGVSLHARVTTVAEGRLHLDLALEMSELLPPGEEGLSIAGQSYRFVREVPSGKPVRLVLKKDAKGKPTKWVECLVKELPIDVEETVSHEGPPATTH